MFILLAVIGDVRSALERAARFRSYLNLYFDQTVRIIEMDEKKSHQMCYSTIPMNHEHNARETNEVEKRKPWQ